MSRIEKLIQRFHRVPADFSYADLTTLLKHLGYQELKAGKTGGSRVVFVHIISRHVIRLHRPHPSPVLKKYQIIQIIESLTEIGLL